MEPNSFWKNPEGVELACYEWLPPDEIKFIAYLVHGSVHGCLHGNVNDMKNIIELINGLNGAVYTHEHFAHGKSGPYPQNDPKRCHIENFHHAMRDLHFRVEVTKKKHPAIKCFLFGNSLGGLIATLMVKEYPNSVDALILTSPAFRVHESTAKWYLKLGAKILNWISPTTRVGDASFAYISRNEETVEKKKKLFAEYGSISGMMAYVLVHMMTVQDKLMTEFDQIEVRTLICAGTDDRLSSLSVIEHAHSQMPNCTLKLYEGAYHNLSEELPETVEAYFNDLRQFILSASETEVQPDVQTSCITETETK